LFSLVSVQLWSMLDPASGTFTFQHQHIIYKPSSLT
jgi:hypothetical protein